MNKTRINITDKCIAFISLYSKHQVDDSFSSTTSSDLGICSKSSAASTLFSADLSSSVLTSSLGLSSTSSSLNSLKRILKQELEGTKEKARAALQQEHRHHQKNCKQCNLNRSSKSNMNHVNSIIRVVTRTLNIQKSEFYQSCWCYFSLKAFK